MTNKQRFFIYGRKEMMVLMLLCITIIAFSFTLGVHVGKQVAITGPTTSAQRGGDPFPVETVQDAVPNRVELAEQMKGAKDAAHEALSQSLHDEVARTGLQLDVKRQTELPEDPKTKNAGATSISKKTEGTKTPDTKTEHRTAAAEAKSDNSSLQISTPRGKYTIQTGSFPSIDEAKKHLEELKGKGVAPFVKSVELEGKGTWFRVYFGGFETRKAAEKTASKYKEEKAIDAYIVSNMP